MLYSNMYFPQHRFLVFKCYGLLIFCLRSTPLRYLLSPSLQKEEAQRVEELGWREMERISAFAGISDSEQRLYIPGGGVTKALYTDW